jgi:hypothetical protein
LDPVEVPNNQATTINVEEKESLMGNTYYSATHSLASRGINATMGVPFTYELFLNLGDKKVPEQVSARFYVGGEQYSFRPIVTSYNILYVDLQGSHLKHFAVSGIQKIVFHKYGDVIHTQEFNAVEQELWRRTAEELISAIDKFKVL